MFLKSLNRKSQLLCLIFIALFVVPCVRADETVKANREPLTFRLTVHRAESPLIYYRDNTNGNKHMRSIQVRFFEWQEIKY